MRETQEEFFAGYAARSGTTVERLRDKGCVVHPCDCGAPGCHGWEMVLMDARKAELGIATVPMTREQALAFVRMHAEAVEPFDPCPECMVPTFPRATSFNFAFDDREREPHVWKPGLVFAQDHHKWMNDFHECEETGKSGEMPQRPRTPTYVPCKTCDGSGTTGKRQEWSPWRQVLAALESTPLGRKEES
jgi:hypothetical protein